MYLQIAGEKQHGHRTNQKCYGIIDIKIQRNNHNGPVEELPKK